jgi:GntR family transcriptional regulator of arabinose operon
MKHAFVLQKVDHADPTPKYLQAREILVEAIRSGQLRPGMKLPSTKEISGLFDISLITAHKALEGLVDLGWLRREAGRGTFVRDDVDPAREAQCPLYIGLLLDHRDHVNLDDYYHGTILNQLRRQARADTRRVEFFFRDRLDLRDKGNRHVGAICIHPPLETQPEVEQLAQGHPVVVLGGAFPGSTVPAFDCDNVTGARRAVRHLWELGHRRFMVLSGPMNMSNSRDRAEGAAAELAQHGIRLAPEDAPVSDDSVTLSDAARAQIARRMAAAEHPTAIVAGGFYLAMAAMQVVRQAGLAIPRDVSVVGFDDPASAPLLDPPLTTVRQPLEGMATQAYESVCRAVEDPRAVRDGSLLAPELIVRQSTGPVPA